MMFSHPDVDLSFNIDLTSMTTFKLKSSGDLAVVKSINGLQALLKHLSEIHRPYRLIGWGANQILPINLSPLLIKLDFSFDKKYFSETHSEYELPASVGLNLLTAHAIEFGLKGWEVLTGIPASVGGAVYMNAGTALGEIASILKSVKIMDNNGKIRDEIISSSSYSYRKNHFVNQGDIIIGATFKNLGQDPEIPKKIKDYLQYRKTTQPLTTKNCGCVFKNYSQELLAGRTIDQLGLKGLSVGPLSVSRKHSNFIENAGGATEKDFYELVNLIQKKVKEAHGIEFELEVKID